MLLRDQRRQIVARQFVRLERLVHDRPEVLAAHHGRNLDERLLAQLLTQLGHQARRDVDQHEGGGVDVILADGDEARPAAHRRPDQHRAPMTERSDHAHEVLQHHVLAV